MKILFLNYEFPPLGGGAGNATYYLFREFAKQSDLQIDLVTSSTDKYYEQQFSPNIKIYFLNIGKKNRNLHQQSAKDLLIYSWKSYWFCKKLIKNSRHPHSSTVIPNSPTVIPDLIGNPKQYDLIHAFFGVPCGYIALKLGLPYIVSLRGSDVPNHNPNFNKIYFLLKPAIKKTWRHAAAVIANSEALKQEAAQFLPLDFQVIPNGVDTDYFKPGIKTDDVFRVLSVGRLHKIKNLDLLINSWSVFMQQNLAANAQLVIVGDGSEYQNLKDLTKQLKLTNTIFTGYLPKEKVLDYYQQSSIFVLLSDKEGMSNSLLEAVACNLSTVATTQKNPQYIAHQLQHRHRPLKSDDVKMVQWQEVAKQYHNIYQLQQPNKKIKICFVQPQLYPFFNTSLKKDIGGAEAQFYLLSNKLAQNDMFTIACVVGNYEQGQIEHHGPITVYRSISPSSNKIIALFQAFYLLFVILKTKADIIIQRAAGQTTGLLALYCKLFRKKFIYMVACDGDTNEQNKIILKNKKVSMLLYRLGIKLATQVICQTNQQKRNLLKYFNKNPIVINSPLYKINNLHEDYTKKSILWVGRMNFLKKPEIFVDLAQKNPHLLFTMIAPTTNDLGYGDYIQKKAAGTKNLSFEDYVPFKEIDQYFQQAMILVNTSDFEGFPNTFIQAAKNKTPILSLNSNPDDFLTKYQCGFCADGSFKKLNYYLNLLVTDKELWNKYAQNAYNYAKQNHDIDKEIIKLEETIINLYNDVRH